MLVALVLMADYYNALDASLWQQLNWWQRSGNIGLSVLLDLQSILRFSGWGVCDSMICAARQGNQSRAPIISQGAILLKTPC